MTLRTIKFDDAEWQVVPREPTDSMFAAADAENDRAFVDGRPHGAPFADMYYAALDAAPEPPAQPEAPTRDLLAEARDQVEALDRENHQMRRCVARLMARLTVWLDDDQFNEADGIMYPEFEPPAQRPMTDPEEHIYNACFTYRHDFGLLPINDQISLMREARRWADAFGIGKGESK